MSPLRASMIASTGLPLRTVPIASFWPFGIPRARRREELQALEVRIATPCRASLRMILPVVVSARNEIDRQLIALREERDERAVGAERRADVHRAAAGALADEQRVGRLRLRRRARLDAVGLADRRVPLGGELVSLLPVAGR